MLKWFSTFIHVAPADYEIWLEKLAGKGFHPKKVSQWSSIVMSFEKSEPKKYRYVLDVQPVPQSDYVPTYEEFGWELCGRMANTYFWRMEYTDIRPESFSDSAAFEERNKRFATAVLLSLIPFLAAAIILTISFFQLRTSLTAGGFIQFGLGMALSYGLSLYLLWAMRKISRNKRSKA